jgi:DNA gyrase/topoisomerase IV subunit B
MDYYKKAIFTFILIIFFIIISIRLAEPVIERQIKSAISEKKFSEKLKKELENSVKDFTPEKRDFYKKIIKKAYIKWKPLINEAIKEADSEINKN